MCDIGTLAPGVVVTVTIVTQAVSAGTITNVPWWRATSRIRRR